MTTFDPALVERVARAICAEYDDCPFDELPTGKQDWSIRRGVFHNRFRDVNEPTVADYTAMALAALAEAFKPQPIETAPDKFQVWHKGIGSWINAERVHLYSVTETFFKLGTGNWYLRPDEFSHWLPLPPPVDGDQTTAEPPKGSDA